MDGTVALPCSDPGRHEANRQKKARICGLFFNTCISLLTLRELYAATSFAQSHLFAFNFTCITSDKAFTA